MLAGGGDHSMRFGDKRKREAGKLVVATSVKSCDCMLQTKLAVSFFVSFDFLGQL